MTDILFPHMSDEAGVEGVVGTWFVNDGESVAAGRVVAEVQVEKVSQDVAAPVAGVFHPLVAEGDAVDQGAPIARIDPAV